MKTIPIRGEKLCIEEGRTGSLRYKTIHPLEDVYIKNTEERAPLDYEYTLEELKVIKSHILALWRRDYRKMAEILVRATNNKDLIEGFYEAPEPEIFANTTMITSLEASEKIQEPLFQKKTYSVYHLCQDLVGREVLVDQELIGEYRKITMSFESKASPTKWIKVRSIVRSSTRANISLFLDNRSRCIIRDGKLNMRYIAIRGELPKGLKKAVVMNLVANDEYLLDLEKLPITSRTDFPEKISRHYVESLQLQLENARIRKIYFGGKSKRAGKSSRRAAPNGEKYEAWTLDIKSTFHPKVSDIRGLKTSNIKRIIDNTDTSIDWNKEYRRIKEEKSKVIFKLLSQKRSLFDYGFSYGKFVKSVMVYRKITVRT